MMIKYLGLQHTLANDSPFSGKKSEQGVEGYS